MWIKYLVEDEKYLNRAGKIDSINLLKRVDGIICGIGMCRGCKLARFDFLPGPEIVITSTYRGKWHKNR